MCKREHSREYDCPLCEDLISKRCRMDRANIHRHRACSLFLQHHQQSDLNGKWKVYTKPLLNIEITLSFVSTSSSSSFNIIMQYLQAKKLSLFIHEVWGLGKTKINKFIRQTLCSIFECTYGREKFYVFLSIRLQPHNRKMWVWCDATREEKFELQSEAKINICTEMKSNVWRVWANKVGKFIMKEKFLHWFTVEGFDWKFLSQFKVSEDFLSQLLLPQQSY
jgi:hypothetical protein